MSMTVTGRFSFDEYFKLEWATASTNPNELLMVLYLFFLFFFCLWVWFFALGKKFTFPTRHEFRSATIWLSHKSSPDWQPFVRALGKTQPYVLCPRIFQCDPESHRRWRGCVQKLAILMGRHSSTNTRLFANNHTLQNSRIPES